MSHPENDVLGVFDSSPFRAEWTADGHVTEESLHAWLDGALGIDDADAVERHAKSCQACAAAVAEARGYIAASMRIMQAADVSPRHVVPHDDVIRTAARVVATADRQHESTVGRWRVRRFVQIAAGLLVMILGAAYIVSRDDSGISPVAPANTVASGTAPSRASGMTPAAATPAAIASAPVRAIDSSSTLLPTVDAAAPVASVVSGSTSVTGRVMDGANPLASASVSIPGTAIGTITDALGRFTLSDVPSTATTLRAQRIGYEAATRPIADTAERIGIDFRLEPVNMMLSSVVVTSTRSIAGMRAARCFISVDDSTSGRAPLVRMLRGTLRDAGTHTLILVGWPAPGELTEGTFSLDSAGTLTGRASVTGATVDFELDADRRSWFGLATETRGVNSRQEDVEFLADTSAQRCLRNE